MISSTFQSTKKITMTTGTSTSRPLLAVSTHLVLVATLVVILSTQAWGATANNPPASSSSESSSSRHLNIFPGGQSISTEVMKDAVSNFGSGTTNEYTLHATYATSEDATSTAAAVDEEFTINVRVATPAVTSKTTTSISGGANSYVNATNVAHILVSNEEDGTFALIAAEKVENGKVHGLIQKGGGVGDIEFLQEKGQGQQAWVTKAAPFTPPRWSCGVGSFKHTAFGGKNSMSHGRSLLKDSHHNEDGIGHDHHEDEADDTHNHHHHHHDYNSHEDHANHAATLDGLDQIQRGLSGNGSSSTVRLGERRQLQGSTKPYNYQVDLYIKIDNLFCALNGEDCSTGIGPNTINYVNALFTGANTVYETEIDTHLNVLHINFSSDYDKALDTLDALYTMWFKYAHPTWPAWHYTSPTGAIPDLHHALLGTQLGGGLVFDLNTVCDPGYGYGLSADLVGDFVMHEIGHHFGAYHTHNEIYTPRIDTCGCFTGEGFCMDETCPAQLPLERGATLMSYCHVCGRKDSNIAYTFGGKYKGSGNRGNINSYTNSPLLVGDVNKEPRQVNVLMYNHVSSRGACTRPPKTGKSKKQTSS